MAKKQTAPLFSIEPRKGRDVMDVVNGEYDYTFQTGDCNSLIKDIPAESIDCVITSPPYFQQREYDFSSKFKDVAIGEEDTIQEYVDNLVNVFREVHRVLKTSGSLWLNIGDKFVDKELAGVPWRVALALKDNGWILRQDIIWNKRKGTQSAKDRMRDIYEHIFHFVKNKKYYFDGDLIRIKPGEVVCKNGKVISATGVSGKKYYEYIEKTNDLTMVEKKNAKTALDRVIKEMKEGKISDFRMTIRGAQRTYHGESEKISGRAKELQDKGYFLLKMNSSGFLPSNIWDIVPEDKWRKDNHCAVFPEELLQIPLLSTCPKGGIVLDPFSGTGTTVSAAVKHDFRGIGFDISKAYNKLACERVKG